MFAPAFLALSTPFHRCPTAHNAPLMSARRHNRPDSEHTHPPEQHGFLHIATLTSTHGVRGEFKARAAGDFATQRLGPKALSTQRYILLPGRLYPRPAKVAPGRPASQPNHWIISVNAIDNPETARKLLGSRIYVRESDRPSLSRGEYMVAQLVGSLVYTLPHDHSTQLSAKKQRPDVKTGPAIGMVTRVITRAELCAASGAGSASVAVANDVLEIALFDAEAGAELSDVPDDAERALVPFVKQIVPLVDARGKRVTIDPPPGLLSATVVNRKERKRPPRGLLMPARQ